ncbi:MAG TPA: prolyl oligopeptidase family serine peptidase [Vicinamibacterales bacterium]|nr:prolyl oligopeptidase family serine peptidase [Vicinamibacterales bacterium]
MAGVRGFLAIVIAAGATVSMSGQRAGQPAPLAGLVRQAWTVDGVERSALVAAPRAAAGGSAAPLVLVFHGHGGTSANAARTFKMHVAWPEAVVIYPQGLPTAGQITDPEGHLPGWQHAAGGNGDRDLHFVDAMLEWATARYSIDAKRIFAAGHSNGGSMVYVLWAARADRFAAFAPSSSVFPLAAVVSAKPKPAFIVSGRVDPLVPFATQQLSLRAVLRLNQASSAAQPWSGGAERHASSIGADVITYIHPGGHPMPDDAGMLMAKFFRSVK